MAPAISTTACFLLCLLALACDAKPGSPPEEKGASARAAVLICPVCGQEFPRDRTVVVHGAAGDVLVCSQACAIRYDVTRLPPAAPDSRPLEIPESQPEEDR